MSNQSNESDSDIASVCSQMSDFSVSVNGEDMPLDQAVDNVFAQIQTAINQIHCDLRQMCQSEDRSDTYEESLEYHNSVKEHITEGCVMFKSLIAISKQLVLPKPKGWKDPKKVGIEQDKLDASFKTD